MKRTRYKFPSNRQLDRMDCGPIALKNIVDFYGKKYSVRFYRSLINTGRLGCSLYDISQAADKLGLETCAVNIGMNLIEEIPLPAIFHWKQNHFIVVYKVKKNRVYVSDPAIGLISYSYQEFQEHWFGRNSIQKTGIALLFQLSKSLNDISQDNIGVTSIRKFALHYLSPYKSIFFKILLSLVLGSLLQLIIPILMQNIMDFGIFQKNTHIIWLILLGQLSLTLGSMIMELLRSWTLLYISNRINLFLLADFFIKLLSLPVGFFDGKITGDILQRINDHKRIETFITNSIINIIFSVFTFLLYSCILFVYSHIIFYVFIAGTFIYLAYISLFLKRRKVMDYKFFQLAADNNTKVFELINSIQEIKLNNAENNKRWQIENLLIKTYKLKIKQTKLDQIQGIGSRLINETKNIIITVIAATYVIDNTLTMGSMLALMYITGQLNVPVLQLVGINRAFQDAKISLNRIDTVYSVKSEPERDALLKTDAIGQTLIRFCGVSFKYNENTPMVLQNVSFSIQKNKTTAIVGGSGSGKSTILKLLLQFYNPTNGSIIVGDENLDSINLHSWRDNCGVVMQEGQLFNDTVAANICIDSDRYDINRLKDCANQVNILSFIETLPLGFDTKIGLDGLSISTGQKQRILIARAIYKNPSLLFFDEATSSLDANNESIISSNIYTNFPDTTKIIVAHRLNTIVNADKIIVIDSGRVVEEGSHMDLLKNKGVYFKLFNNQLNV